MLDLHTHTNYSDGTWTVKELLKKAQESKIELLSITDHNNVKAHLELRDNDYTHIFNNRIINGVELNVIAHGSSIEVLVYDFDLDTINNWCLNNYKSVTTEELLREYKEMYLNALKHGIILDSCEYNPHECFPVEFIYNNIKKHSENRNKFEESVWNSFGSFLRYFSYDLDFPVYVNLSNVFPDIKDAVKVAHESGGKVFLAHLYKYPNKHDILLKYLTDNKLIDGIEVYHSSFSKEQMDYLYNYCKSNNLLMSGGSDCHGEKKLSRKIGVGYNNLNINKSIVDNWI